MRRGRRVSGVGRRVLLPAAICLAACVPASRVERPTTPDTRRPTLALPALDSIVLAHLGTRYAGAALVVSVDGRVVHERAFGHAALHDGAGARLDPPPAVTPATMFDLASLTKVLATTNALMLLADRGAVDLDAPAARWLPALSAPPHDRITVRHLLTHAGGLAQWQPMYYHAGDAAATRAAIRRLPLGWPVGEGRHYSDLGFMLLGAVVERAGGRPLDRFVQEELVAPLGLRRTAFNPGARGERDVAATERGNAYERQMVFDPDFGYDYAGDPTTFTGWRTHWLRGEVNDGNAWHAHGGVAGHAGLFASARDAAALADLVALGGISRGRRLVRAETVARFTAREPFGHALGWMRPPGLPEGALSHTGFTGTWVLVVPSRRLTAVLLTNRQQMGRDARGFFPDLAPVQRAVAEVLLTDGL